MDTLRLLCLMPIAFYISPAFAASCNQSQADRATALAGVIGQTLVPRYFLGGKNISAAIDGCQYDEASDAFTVHIDVKWNGVLMVWNSYEAWGEAKSNWTGDKVSCLFCPRGRK